MCAAVIERARFREPNAAKCITRVVYDLKNKTSTACTCKQFFFQHRPCCLCYDRDASLAGTARGKEGGWTLSPCYASEAAWPIARLSGNSSSMTRRSRTSRLNSSTVSVSPPMSRARRWSGPALARHLLRRLLASQARSERGPRCPIPRPISRRESSPLGDPDVGQSCLVYEFLHSPRHRGVAWCRRA
jgi:hypothetical protein